MRTIPHFRPSAPQAYCAGSGPQSFPVGDHAFGIMRDAAADNRLGAAAQLSGHQVAAKCHVRRNLLRHHSLHLLHRRWPALRQTAYTHGDHHIGFGGKRPGIHADVEPIGVFRCCGHVLTLTRHRRMSRGDCTAPTVSISQNRHILLRRDTLYVQSALNV